MLVSRGLYSINFIELILKERTLIEEKKEENKEEDKEEEKEL
jgi:hypothetical protein